MSSTPAEPGPLIAPYTNPYVGPRTFAYADRRRFFGRETEAAALRARVVSERLLLFYAQSGAGKSSLINTRLIPALREEKGYSVLPVGRVSGELPAGVDEVANIYLFNLMASLDQGGGDPQRLADLKLVDFLEHMVTDDGVAWRYDPAAADAGQEAGMPAPEDEASEPPLRFALIVDQFEEIVTGHVDRWRERDEFFRQLDGALSANRNLWVVLSLREDYLASLDTYAPLLFNRLRARFYMERMGVAAALDAVRRPAELGSRPFAPGVAEQLVEDLRQVRVSGQEATVAGQYVEPVQLQVVCYQLWERLGNDGKIGRQGDKEIGNAEPRAAGLAITAADLAAAGDVNEALEQFYTGTLAAVQAEPAVQGAGVGERSLRTWFDRELITATGIRSTVYRNDASGLTGSLPNLVVDELGKRFLLRTELRGGGAWVELVHDRFVEPIRASNAAWFPLHLSALQRQAALWNEQGRTSGLLLRDQALVDAEAWAETHPDELSAHEQEFLAACREAQDALARERRQSRRILGLAGVAALLFAAASIAFFLAFNLSKQAEALKRMAEMAQEQGAESERRAAQAWIESQIQSRVAQAQVLASTAPELTSERFQQNELAYLLAAQAVRVNPPEGRDIHWLLDRSLRMVLGPSIVTVLETGEAVNSVKMSPDGEFIYVASGDTIYEWAVSPLNEEPKKFAGHTATVTSVAVSPDGRELASGSRDGSLRTWDAHTGELALTMEGHLADVLSVAYSPDGTMIASASRDNTARVWDTVTGSELLVLVGHTDSVQAASFNPDGRMLITAGADGTARQWDIVIGEEIVRFTGDEYYTSAAFGPSGAILATGGSDFDVKLWDPVTGELIESLPCHLDEVSAVIFSPDEQKLASAGRDNSICVWDMENLAAPPATFAGHEGYTNSVEFSPDGTQLVSGSNDGTVRIWMTYLHSMVEAACQRAGRNMSQSEWQRFLPQMAYEKTCPEFP